MGDRAESRGRRALLSQPDADEVVHQTGHATNGFVTRIGNRLKSRSVDHNSVTPDWAHNAATRPSWMRGPVTAETGVWIADGPRVGPATVERILCEGSVEVIARTEDGEPLAMGRTSRAIPPRLRRFVLARDGGCTADGCTSRYRLQPHHRVPWSEGGPTDPSNLTTLCWYHPTWSFTAEASPSTRPARPAASASGRRSETGVHPQTTDLPQRHPDLDPVETQGRSAWGRKKHRPAERQAFSNGPKRPAITPPEPNPPNGRVQRVPATTPTMQNIGRSPWLGAHGARPLPRFLLI